MRLVIDIPEETYHEINLCGLFLSPRDKEALVTAIRNGIVLLKGHGRLIDADKLYKEQRMDISDIAPVVLEADMEVKKGER